MKDDATLYSALILTHSTGSLTLQLGSQLSLFAPTPQALTLTLEALMLNRGSQPHLQVQPLKLNSMKCAQQ